MTCESVLTEKYKELTVFKKQQDIEKQQKDIEQDLTKQEDNDVWMS